MERSCRRRALTHASIKTPSGALDHDSIMLINKEGHAQSCRCYVRLAVLVVLLLVCGSAALFHSMYLVPLALCQLCEAHSVVLRGRSLLLLSGKHPSDLVWAFAWVTFGVVRLLPHAVSAILAQFWRNSAQCS